MLEHPAEKIFQSLIYFEPLWDMSKEYAQRFKDFIDKYATDKQKEKIYFIEKIEDILNLDY